MLSLRLDPKLELAIEQKAKQLAISKSELVRNFLKEWLKEKKLTSPHELGEDLFGNYGSGKKTLSVQAKKIAREKILKKHGRNPHH